MTKEKRDQKLCVGLLFGTIPITILTFTIIDPLHAMLISLIPGAISSIFYYRLLTINYEQPSRHGVNYE